jgi:hypothetical protein
MSQPDLTDVRPTIPGMRTMLLVASGLVFTIGISLFVLSEQTERFFAWTIASPMTAAFLGAAYWASAVLEFQASRERAWCNARIAVPAVLLFTTLTLIVTLLHVDRFHFAAPLLITRIGTWTWLLVYALVPIIMGVLLVVQLRQPGGDPPRTQPLPPWARWIFVAQAAIMAPLGLALLLAPAAAAPLWPWALTPLTARAVGAWLISLGVAAGHVAWENDRRRVRPASSSYLVLAALELLALLRYGGELRWGEPGPWLYVLFLLVMLGLGGWLSLGRRTPSPTPARP